MRTATSFLVLVSSLAIASGAAAKRPAPIQCTTDVAAAVAAACPCAGQGTAWRNHGQYVKCVAHLRNALRKSHCFPDDSVRRTLARCAASSTCGHHTTVFCCHYVVATCSDPTPGDGVKAGACSNDATVACDVAGDCTRSSARTRHDANACTARGDVVVEGGGSACTPCPPPPGATTTTTTVTTTTTTLP